MKKKILGGFEICISAPLEVAKQLLFSLNQISLLNMEKLSYGNRKPIFCNSVVLIIGTVLLWLNCFSSE